MRPVFRHLSLAVLAMLVATIGFQSYAQSTQEQSGLLRHVVCFKFKESATPAQIKAVEESFAALEEKIPEILAFEFGTNNSPEGLDKGFTHCFLLTFKTASARDIYLPHPDHKAFAAGLDGLIDDVFVIDYWTK